MGEISGDGTAVQGLGGASGYGETALPRGDEGFVQVDISAVFEDGIVIDGVTYGGQDLFISTDGFVTFGSGVASLPDDPASLTMPFIAPFMADIDTRLDGEGTESGQIWLDVDTGQDCVTITWEDVGFYRRNATYTNTFQLQLFDRGNGSMDVVFRYDSIEWTSGDLEGGSTGTGGDPALIGYRMDASGAVTYIGASGDEGDLLALPDTPGNTGISGLFVFRLGGIPVPITGGSGGDTIFGTAGDDTLQGLGGNDALMGSVGADQMDGGGGTDLADYSGSADKVGIDLADPTKNTGWAAGDTFVSVENLNGTLKDDFLSGNSANNQFNGSDGKDSLLGQGGNDTLLGGKGNDTVDGGGGADLLDCSSGEDSGRGGDGDDWLQGGSGNDSLSGEGGDDLIDGGDHNDSLLGAGGQDVLTGAGGNDTIKGQDGADTLEGGAGADSLLGNGGNDQIWGGDGIDTLRGSGGDDFIFGGGADDSLKGEGGNDDLAGDAGGDEVYGGGGNDSLSGGGGQDLLKGENGDDLIWGGDQNDTLSGGSGLDLYQHSGALGEGTDWITDYNPTHGDVLLFGISGADANDFSVGYAQSGGGTNDEAFVTYLPTGQVIWVLEDAENLTTLTLQSGSNSFNLL